MHGIDTTDLMLQQYVNIVWTMDYISNTLTFMI
jgi:hypothetical protein